MTSQSFVDPCTDPQWEQLVGGPDGSLFVSPPWLRALRDTYGYQFRASIVGGNGHPQSGFAWAELNDMRGHRAVGLPFCDFADPIVSEEPHWDLLLAPLLALDVSTRLRTRQQSHRLDTDERFTVINRTAWHGVDLCRSIDEIWSGIGESARRAVRKAEKQGVEVREAASADDLRTFHRLHCGVRRTKYGMLTQPFSLFENIWRQFGPDRTKLLLAEHDGVAVGATFYLIWGSTIYYKFNASSPQVLNLRPNDLLTWKGIELGAQLGMRNLDFGQSDLDQEGLLRYKEKFATEIGTITTHVANPPTPDRASEQWSVTLRELTTLFVSESVSQDVYEQAGDLLYSQFC